MTYSLLILRGLTFLVIYFLTKKRFIVYNSILIVYVCVIFVSSVNFYSMFFLLEVSVIPMLFLLLSFGRQPEKISASYYLVFYSVTYFMPILILLLEKRFFVTFIISWYHLPSFYLFMFRLGFLIKFPLYFFHLWLPKLHVEAPTSASILLASLVLKMGTFGFFRLLPYYSWGFFNYFLSIRFVGIAIGSLICVFFSDIKALVAMSSVVHINFLFLVILIDRLFTSLSSFIIMVSHGLVSLLIFGIVGEFYLIFNTRIIYFVRGLQSSSFLTSLCLFFLLISNRGAPLFLRFFPEVVGLGCRFNVYLFLFIFVGIYYLVVLYYNLSLGVILCSGFYLKKVPIKFLFVIVPVLSFLLIWVLVYF